MKIVLLAALTLMSCSTALAGKCAVVRPFVETAQAAPLVVQATVLRHVPTLLPPGFVEVRVKAVYRGAPTSMTLRVFDAATSEPVQPATALPDGSTWIMALEPTSGGEGYRFLPCANAFGALVGRAVFANAYGNQDVLLPLDELRGLLRR
ncbi:hypothetical protein [Deinococcus pimensis]|uniref:hypothetical protein n=1 Tax=Deinococcus pimensis TaxID=309888 RepID=UPI0004884174|nr:hypothetical protein [Deinococcus pimensis]